MPWGPASGRGELQKRPGQERVRVGRATEDGRPGAETWTMGKQGGDGAGGWVRRQKL